MLKNFIFISFASPQEKFANKIYEALKASGIDCFCSSNSLNPGDMVYSEISKRLESDKRILLPIYSNEYFSESRV